MTDNTVIRHVPGMFMGSMVQSNVKKILNYLKRRRYR